MVVRAAARKMARMVEVGAPGLEAVAGLAQSCVPFRANPVYVQRTRQGAPVACGNIAVYGAPPLKEQTTCRRPRAKCQIRVLRTGSLLTT